MSITIFHNPKCGTSRNTLAMIRNAGIEPTIVEYLKTPLSQVELRNLVNEIGAPIRDIMRQKESVYAELDLDNAKWNDEALIDFMVQHPILLNRPIVCSPKGTRLCRPSELVLDLLDAPQKAAFYKEDGEMVVDEQGRRV